MRTSITSLCLVLSASAFAQAPAPVAPAAAPKPATTTAPVPTTTAPVPTTTAAPVNPPECDVARIRETQSLSTAIASDRQMAQRFADTAKACASPGDLCDSARLACGTMLTATVKGQVSFDEGAWLRDMMLPYLGQTYQPARALPTQTTPLATDVSCDGDAALLTAAASRRTQQAQRREQLLTEYPLYVKWASAAQQLCKDKALAEAQRTAAAKLEAEKLAAAAATASAAEAARQKAEADAKKAAEEAQKSAEQKEKEAQAKLEAEKAAAEKKAKDEKEAAEKKLADEKAAAEQKAKDEKDALQKQLKADKEEAVAKAAATEEAKLVAAREEKIAALKKQKKQLVTDAEAKLARLTEDAELKKKQAAEALNTNPQMAQTLVQDAARAQAARDAAVGELAEAKRKAEAIEIDDSHERSKGSFGFQLGGGVAGWPNMQGVLGLTGMLHLGFWGTAPSKGLANGFEVRINAKFLKSLLAPREFEGFLNLTYFFGPFGIGAVGDFQLQPVPTPVFRVAGGLGIALAMVDQPMARVIARVNYTPLGSLYGFDPARVNLDLEISVGPVFGSIQAGLGGLDLYRAKDTDPLPLGWKAAGFLGLRHRW